MDNRPSPPPPGTAAVGRGPSDVAAVIDLRDDDVFHRSPDRTFDRLTRLAERLLRVPIALVSLEYRGYHRLAGSREMPSGLSDRRSSSPMSLLLDATVEHGDQLIVQDTRELDFLGPETQQAGLVAFAGHPLVATTGEVIGALCVIADQPRMWHPEERQLLADLAAIASTEAELHARAGRLAEVAARLGTIADPLQATDDAVTSLANIADRAGDPRVERLASLARERLRGLRDDTKALRDDLGHITGRDEADATAAVNIAVRILRAVRLVESALPHADLEVDVRDRPLTVAGNGLAYERRLVRLLSAVAAQAGDRNVRIVVERRDTDAVVRLHWNHRIPVPELARLATLAHALRAGDEGGNAALSTIGGRTSTTLDHGEAATGPDGTDVVASVPLRSAPDSGATLPAPTPGVFPWGT